jgi:hypothetical protein
VNKNPGRPARFLKIIARLRHKTPLFFRKFNPGDIITRFSNDLYIVTNFFYMYLLYSISYLFAGLTLIVFLLYRSSSKAIPADGPGIGFLKISLQPESKELDFLNTQAYALAYAGYCSKEI